MKWLLKNPINRFVLLFVVAYALILGLGSMTSLGEGYGSALRWQSEKVFQNWFDNGYILFEKAENSPDKSMDSAVRFFNLEQNEVAMRNQTTVYSVTVYYDSYIRGFLLIAFFLSLVIASPVPLKRKLIGSVIGFLILQGFVLFRTYVDIYYTMQQSPKLDIVAPSAFSQSLIIAMDAALVKNIVIAFVIPLIIWILVTFTKDDRKVFTDLVVGKTKKGV